MRVQRGSPLSGARRGGPVRGRLQNDPAWSRSKVEAYLKGGAVPSFTYHRFWAQADIALAMGSYADLFE
ncbi:glycoside hydrolase family 48 protein [Streptomyces sp. NPDC020125]|uniref:glycoside hydrolase family 48 protein n=1 Tax=Streptomyces sp. NPDC020125 TaxID=3154593 RepID=UPI0033E99DB4